MIPKTNAFIHTASLHRPQDLSHTHLVSYSKTLVNPLIHHLPLHEMLKDEQANILSMNTVPDRWLLIDTLLDRLQAFALTIKQQARLDIDVPLDPTAAQSHFLAQLLFQLGLIFMRYVQSPAIQWREGARYIPRRTRGRDPGGGDVDEERFRMLCVLEMRFRCCAKDSAAGTVADVGLRHA